MNLTCVWKHNVLYFLFQHCRNLFEQDGLKDTDLENDNYKAAYSKLQLEEAMLNLNQDEPPRMTRDYEIKSYESRIRGGDSDYED